MALIVERDAVDDIARATALVFAQEDMVAPCGLQVVTVLVTKGQILPEW
jgi:hypothetical protein